MLSRSKVADAGDPIVIRHEQASVLEVLAEVLAAAVGLARVHRLVRKRVVGVAHFRHRVVDEAGADCYTKSICHKTDKKQKECKDAQTHWHREIEPSRTCSRRAIPIYKCKLTDHSK